MSVTGKALAKFLGVEQVLFNNGEKVKTLLLIEYLLRGGKLIGNRFARYDWDSKTYKRYFIFN